ncbi:MAG: glycosyltransferase [Lachnospiraceae bacterium]|nr:glycosyltransferase [Lachnospiraceae bacterium]
MVKTIVVMPVANEAGTLEEELREILALPYDNLYVYPVVDAFSHDDTPKIIDTLERETDGRVHKLFYKESRGVVSCYLYGFKCALADGAQHIIEMDGGMSHKPSEISEFIEKLDAGYDCVWGSRFIRGGGIEHHPWYRRVLSKGGTWLANLVLGTHLHDMTSGFEGFQRKVLEQLDLDAFLSRGHMYQTEMRFYCRGLKTVEVPINYTGGSSSLKAKSVTEALHILFCLKKHESAVRLPAAPQEAPGTAAVDAAAAVSSDRASCKGDGRP